MKETISIELKCLRFFSYHGWLEEEAKTGNEFEVEMSIQMKVVGEIVAIDQTVNYARVYELIKEEMAAPQKLLETVAQRIGVRIEQEFSSILSIYISIKKLTAPIPNFIGSVGVSYTKEFE